MIKAGFVSSAPNWHWSRQFPKSIPVWENVEFCFSDHVTEYDIVFVYDAIPKNLCGRICANHAVFIASEPENVKKYRTDFLSQFDLVLTTDKSTTHKNLLFGQVGLPWLVGAWSSDGSLLSTPSTFDDFANLYPRKHKLVSVVSSDKAFTPQHRERLEFVEKLKKYFGNDIDYYGRNINGFGDKSEVLSSYRYHISLENCSIENYWTEKLSDSYLTLTYPIYYGCPNINDFFSETQISAIDIRNSDAAINTIKKIINSNTYEDHRSDLISARQKVMSEFNIFAVLSKIARNMQDKKIACPVKPLDSEDFFKRHKTRLGKAFGRGKRSLKRAIER